MRNSKAFAITPVPKPRMTKRDRRGDKRPAVARYHAFKDECRMLGVMVPECNYHVVFVLPMPRSWPKWKREAMNGTPHQQTPDKDNLEKALLDACYGQDCRVWDGRATKIWGVEGGIIINTMDGDGVDIADLVRHG